MCLAERIAEEMHLVAKTDKKCIVLEARHRQEWQPIVEAYRKYLGGFAILEFKGGMKLGEERYYRTDIYEYKKTGYVPYITDKLQTTLKDSIVPQGLIDLCDENRGVGLLVLSCLDMMGKESIKQTVDCLTQLLSSKKSCPLVLIVVRYPHDLPETLTAYAHFIKRKPPEPEELRLLLEQALGGRRLDAGMKNKIVSYLQGFQSYEIPPLFRIVENTLGMDTTKWEENSILDLIGREKVRMLEQEQLLEFHRPKNVQLANMDALIAHIEDSGAIMANAEEASHSGVNMPKGILILGLPGTGKSLTAQYAAQKLVMPLLRLDMGKMMGGHVGDSERNLREAQSQAESMAPCILWIDEIEKGFAGTGGKSREENGYLQRMLGNFLNWLQEKKSTCYVIATANSVDGLPPELFRKGRFDECFCTSMPMAQELRGIFEAKLKRDDRKHVVPYAQEAFNALLQKVTSRYNSKSKETASAKLMTGADLDTLVSNVFKRLFLDYKKLSREQQLKQDKRTYDCEHFIEVLKREFEKMKTFGETNGADIARNAVIVRTSNFVAASGVSVAEEKLSDAEKKYNEVLEQFTNDKIRILGLDINDEGSAKTITNGRQTVEQNYSSSLRCLIQEEVKSMLS